MRTGRTERRTTPSGNVANFQTAAILRHGSAVPKSINPTFIPARDRERLLLSYFRELERRIARMHSQKTLLT
jgi:hypothetical protein